MKKLLFFLALMAALASCGNTYKAKSVVEKFLGDNLVNPDCEVRCLGLKSTNKISADVVRHLQEQAAAGDSLFKHPLPYAAFSTTDTLYYERVTIIHHADTFVRTVYLLPSLEDGCVVAVKEN
jgi:hypothetical protein